MTNESSGRSLPRASTILSALEGVRNIRAGILTAVVFIAGAVVFALFSYLTTRFGSFALAAFGGLLVILISVYGSSAVGFMLMNDAKGAPPLTPAEALTLALSSTHRWIGVMLLAALVFGLFALALVIILFVCKIPFLGPVLYAVVLPVATIATAVFLAAMYFVVMPLAFPAVWLGATTMQAVSKLLAIVRQRLVQVIARVLLLMLLCFVAGGIISSLMFGGLAVVGGLSAALLPNLGGGMGGSGGFSGLMFGILSGAGREGGGYLIAGGIGGAIIFAVVMIVPLLILLRGYCSIYLDVIQGIDFSVAESQLKSGMEILQAKAREAQERAREKMQSAPVTPAAPAADAQRESTAAVPPAAPAAAAGADIQMPVAGRCPKCGTTVAGDDKFCGGCGTKLN